MRTKYLYGLLGILLLDSVQAGPVMRPPAFIGGIPGGIQFAQMSMQRHQTKTLLYREALEQLRKNPQAADVPDCPAEPSIRINLCLRIPDPPPPTETVLQIRRRIAVLIGNNAYPDPIPALETPISDVDEIARLLRNRFGYETVVLHNATKANIIHTINKIAAEVGQEDSVLLFYAGHGYLMDDTKMGFWIPVDAATTSPNNWISNTDISKLLHAIPSRQVLLISDSCFSGSLTREQKLTQALSDQDAVILQRRAVLAFSSGGEEPVSDEGKDEHSIFAWHFIKTLEKLQGRTAGFDVYHTVRKGVVQDMPIQEPQYGAVISAGHTEGGEYLFHVKGVPNQ